MPFIKKFAPAKLSSAFAKVDAGNVLPVGYGIRYHGPMYTLRFLALLSLWAHMAGVWALDTVSLQLKWTHAFQFAGYYAALEKGYYREAGLDVILREGGPGSDALESVLSGKAQYGVGTSSLLLARQAGQPVVVLAVVFQHSPLVLVARRDHANPSIHDISGKRVMIEPHSDELIAYLKQEGITPTQLQPLPHSAKPQDLISGRVDAMSAYVTHETYYFDRAGLSYQTYTPRLGGIDFYGDNLFTSELELKRYPERVRAFRKASLRGWQYAMAHPEEIADLILTKYSQQHPRDFYHYEATRMAPLMRTDLIDIGYMTRGRWRHIADTYNELGLLPANFDLDGFLYEPDAPPVPTHLYLILGLVAAFCTILFPFLRLRHRLADALAEKQHAQEQLAAMALTDPQTNLPHRPLLQVRLEQLLAALRRDGDHAALFVLKWPETTQCQAILCHLQKATREVDTLGHLGDRTIILLLGALPRDAVQARAQAEQVAARILSILSEFGPPVSALILCDSTANGEDLLRQAENAICYAQR